MTVLLPASGRSSFKGENRGATPQNTEFVLLVLLVEGEPAGQTDDTGLDALRLEPLGSINGDSDFTTSANDSEVLILFFHENVATADGLFKGGALQIR